MLKRRVKRRRRRVRRNPEEARALILEAAQRVFTDKGPDVAGLKDVARAAGVSHGLVTHYFGTYEALVEAAIAERVDGARRRILEQLSEGAIGGPLGVIDALFDTLERPEYGRMLAWALLSGHALRDDFPARRVQAPKQVADLIEHRLRERLGEKAPIDRDAIEFLVLVVLSAGIGYGLAREVMWGAMGRKADVDRHRDFRRRLGELVSGYVRARFGVEPA
jgi:AcrR family transcriptional regulator